MSETRTIGLRCLGALVMSATSAMQGMAQATGADSTALAIGAFADVYYAYDARRPVNIDRAFTTQAARHNEFNVNLAFLEAKFTSRAARARLAVQAGTSVHANYAAEPRVGTVSGHELSRLLQEAVIGIRLRPRLWIDGGIFFSHIGAESWISRDNWNYTRSLVAEFTPYYESGARATWNATARFTAQLNVINGWQNISETNGDKSAGVRLDFAVSPTLGLTYDNLVGNEAPDGARTQRRVFHEVMIRSSPAEAVQLLILAQRGTQRRATGPGQARWSGGAVLARIAMTPATALAGRLEAYSDPEQVIVATGVPAGLRATGASLGLDVSLDGGPVWRTEVRALRFTDRIYPARAADGRVSSDAVVVTALAFTMPALTLQR